MITNLISLCKSIRTWQPVRQMFSVLICQIPSLLDWGEPEDMIWRFLVQGVCHTRGCASFGKASRIWWVEGYYHPLRGRALGLREGSLFSIALTPSSLTPSPSPSPPSPPTLFRLRQVSLCNPVTFYVDHTGLDFRLHCRSTACDPTRMIL